MNSRNTLHETQIPGGPLVISQFMPDVQTVSLGMWVDAGSRDEDLEQAGISHALEHMLFKGTEQHDAKGISLRMDDLGGHVNAFTTHERTCFHSHCLFEDWPKALGLLTELLLSATIPATEWQRERGVIFSEMHLLEDSPEEWLMDRHFQALFPDQKIGLPVLGNPDALMRMTQQDLLGYLQLNYRPPRLLVAAAGRIEHNELIQVLTSHAWPRARTKPVRSKPDRHYGMQTLIREIEQAYFSISFPGIHAVSRQRPIAWLANQMLGGGMSSYLFQEVREKRGLAYSIGSQVSSFSDTGIWTVYGATEPERLRESMDVIEQTINKFIEQGPAQEEFIRAKKQLQIQIRMGMDSVEQNMFRLSARFDEMEVRPLLYWIDALEKVDYHELRAWAGKQLKEQPMWSFCGSEKTLKSIRVG